MSPIRFATSWGLPLLLAQTAAAVSSLRAVLPEHNPTLGWVEWGPLHDDTLERLQARDEAALAEVLSVRVDIPQTVPSILGNLRLVDATLRFTPRFPWRPGLDYRAVLRSLEGEVHELRFRIPAVETRPTTFVSRIHPAVDAVPANLLRFYVEFSARMAGDDALAFVTLLDGDGEPIEGAFVETAPLWDPSRTRLTLICHPGRIKRGLKLHERLGPPLREGAQATLVIGEGLQDAWGQPLAGESRLEYSITDSDRTAPSPRAWTIDAPRVGTMDPLVVAFGESLDVQLLERMLAVDHVTGEERVIPDGSAWEFRPARAWTGDAVELLVDARLEDLAGNRIDAPFEQTGAADSKPTPLRLRIALEHHDRR